MSKYSVDSLINYAAYIYKTPLKPKSLQSEKSYDFFPFHDNLFL